MQRNSLSNSMPSINILMFFDDAFYPSALTLLDSVLDHTCHNIILYTAKTVSSKRFGELLDRPRLRIHWLDMEEIVESVWKEELSRFPRIAIYRVFAPFLLPAEKVIYLDSDMICNGDLSAALSIDLGGASLAACAGGNLFNSGFMIMDTKTIKEKHSIAEFRDYIQGIDTALTYPDQEILNHLYFNDVLLVSDRFNYRLWNRIIGRKVSPFIIGHYLGKVKPFHYKYTNFSASRFFWRYAIKNYGLVFYLRTRILSLIYWPYAAIRRLLFHVGGD